MRFTVRAMASCLLLLGWSPSWAGGAPAWFLVEITAARPTCASPADPQSRCLGTQGRVARFEMRDGEKIAMPEDPAAMPPVWTALNGTWVYAPAVSGTAARHSIALDATPMGARLIIELGESGWVRSLALDEWVRLDNGLDADLWVRVSRQTQTP